MAKNGPGYDKRDDCCAKARQDQGFQGNMFYYSRRSIFHRTLPSCIKYQRPSCTRHPHPAVLPPVIIHMRCNFIQGKDVICLFVVSYVSLSSMRGWRILEEGNGQGSEDGASKRGELAVGLGIGCGWRSMEAWRRAGRRDESVQSTNRLSDLRLIR